MDLSLAVGIPLHFSGPSSAGKNALDSQLPTGEPKLRAVFDKLTVKFGGALVIVGQNASVGALRYWPVGHVEQWVPGSSLPST
ncbi:hypothetical protein OHN74_22210 [Streptomyces sp. NBC_00459]